LFGLEYVAPPIKSAGPVEQSDGDNQPESWQLQAMHTYDWDTFENQVLGEKFALLDSLFSDDHGYGNSFLYSIMCLLRQAQPDGMNIARLAYLLARREPDRRAAEEVKARYQTFTENIYRWALHEEDRRQLITAIMLYVYNNREEKEDRTYEW
jgi:CRISPR-associated protein Csm1